MCRNLGLCVLNPNRAKEVLSSSLESGPGMMKVEEYCLVVCAGP